MTDHRRFHAEQFILFAGQAKAGKSWLMIKSAIAAQEAGKKVLFITFEMSREGASGYDMTDLLVR